MRTQSYAWRSNRRGFSLLEVSVVLVIAGIVGSMSAGRFHDLIVQQRVARAATAVQNDLEAAFATAARNRKPVRISWSASTMQLNVTSRDGSRTYRHTGLGRDAYGLTSSAVSVSQSPVEVFPNGLAADTLLVTLSMNNTTKRVRMTRAGLVQIQ